MSYIPYIHNRRSIRLKGYDYSQAGLYFITICCYNRECLFGDVVNGEMVLNEYGTIACNEWLNTPNIRKKVELDVFVIMPNHMHGIIILNGRGELHSPNNVITENVITDNKMGECNFTENVITDNKMSECNFPDNVITDNKMGECNFTDNVIPDNKSGECNFPDNVIPDNKSGECNSPLRGPSNNIGQLFGDINHRLQNN
jgi:putative transposase